MTIGISVFKNNSLLHTKIYKDITFVMGMLKSMLMFASRVSPCPTLNLIM